MHTRAGFRAVSAKPALIFVEIAWRWTFGAAAWALVFLALHRIFSRTDVSQLELLLSRHSDLFLIADAGARILSQVLPQLAAEALVLVPAIAVLWIVAATVGRVVTLNALVDHAGGRSRGFVRVLILDIMRAALTLAAALAWLGAVLLFGATLAMQHMAAALALSFVVIIVVLSCWSAVNWFVALAPIWMVRDGQGVFAAIGASLDLYRRSPGAYIGIASSFGLMRFGAVVVATLGALIATQSTPARGVAATIAIALGYFGVADFLYIARLAAYLKLDESSQLAAIGSHLEPGGSNPAYFTENSSAPPETSPLSS